MMSKIHIDSLRFKLSPAQELTKISGTTNSASAINAAISIPDKTIGKTLSPLELKLRKLEFFSDVESGTERYVVFATKYNPDALMLGQIRKCYIHLWDHADEFPQAPELPEYTLFVKSFPTPFLYDFDDIVYIEALQYGCPDEIEDIEAVEAVEAVENAENLNDDNVIG